MQNIQDVVDNILQQMRLRGASENTLSQNRWSIYAPIVNFHHENGIDNYSDELLKRLCETQERRYMKGEISRKRYRSFVTAAFRIRSYINTGKVDFSIVKDSLTNRKDYEASHPEIILPVVFRMELCCGMRPSEPLNLKVEDVNLKTGDVFIRKSKRGKSRHIVMSEDMKQLCVVYDGLAGKREWFFQYPNGGKIPTRWAQWNFTKAWNNTGLMTRLNNPRPYDLRHNFATRTLMRWVDQGHDVMTLMPYLSTYMGHVNLEETLYYVHLLPERIKYSPGINWDMLNDIYYAEEESYAEY